MDCLEIWGAEVFGFRLNTIHGAAQIRRLDSAFDSRWGEAENIHFLRHSAGAMGSIFISDEHRWDDRRTNGTNHKKIGCLAGGKNLPGPGRNGGQERIRKVVYMRDTK